MSQICISGSTHTMNLTQYSMKKTGMVDKYLSKSKGDAEQDQSGPIDNDDELICDILTEMVATLFKVFFAPKQSQRDADELAE